MSVDPYVPPIEKKKIDPFDRGSVDAQIALSEAVAICRSIDRHLSDIEGGIRELKNSPGTARIRRAKKSLQQDLHCLRRNFAVLACRFIERQPDPNWFEYAESYFKKLLE